MDDIDHFLRTCFVLISEISGHWESGKIDIDRNTSIYPTLLQENPAQSAVDPRL
jgi:hypothetical protein